MKSKLAGDKERIRGRAAEGCVMVIFGGTGDLTKRLLLPALCNLGAEGLLSDNFYIVSYARNDYDTKSYRNYIEENLDAFVKDDKALSYGKNLLKRMSYVQGEFKKADDFNKLKCELERLHQEEHAPQNYIFYLATPPLYFADIVQQLGDASLTIESEAGWRRIVIEKPFGHDLESAQRLNADITKVLSEEQIYRIDHYLGKETVQNLMAFRFANGIFEPIWNRRYVDHVQITVAESLGVELRGSYYDQAGALRDMVPNHMFQLLSYIAMEPPISLDADAVRDEKAKLLRAVKEILPEDVLTQTVRGQYAPGRVEGQDVAGYRSEQDVPHRSPTETYVAIKLLIDNWRWAGVPFYVRTGKRLKTRATEIAIQFKTPPLIMFKETQVGKLSPNWLVIHVQPEEGISLQFGAKIPGPLVRIGDVNMKFQYEDYFGSRPGTGYETLLYDCMMGDSTLFQRADMVVSAWRVVEPILDVWKALTPRNYPNYEAGSQGPKEADELIERDGRKWRSIG